MVAGWQNRYARTRAAGRPAQLDSQRHPACLNRPGDAPDLLQPKPLAGETELVPHLIAPRSTHTDPAGLG